MVRTQDHVILLTRQSISGDIILTSPRLLVKCKNTKYFQVSIRAVILLISQCRFLYGGCGGNHNNFENKTDCESFCSDVVSETNVTDSDMNNNTDHTNQVEKVKYWDSSFCLQSPRHGNCHEEVNICRNNFPYENHVIFSGAKVVLLPLGQRLQTLQLQRLRRQHEHVPQPRGV